MSETLPLSNVKSKFSEMVDRVEHTHDRIIVTRNGRPAAVLIFALRVTSSAERQLDRLPDATAAIVEFMLGALLENPHGLGGELQRELSGIRSARRGVYRIIYEIDDVDHLVIVHRIEHRATAYRPR